MHKLKVLQFYMQSAMYYIHAFLERIFFILTTFLFEST